MTHTETALLSLLQGATEFLPVSSSGHLQIAQTLARMHGGELSAANNMAFTLLVHVGTLIAIGWVFRQRLFELARYLFAGGWQATRSEGWRAAWLDRTDGRLLLAIVVANIPTAFAGVLFEPFFERLYSDPARMPWVGYALLVTAGLLIATRWRRSNGGEDTGSEGFPLWVAFAIGLAQSAALVPGISRSGATIAVAILLGVRRRTAGELSFLIAVPAIAGAMVFKILSQPDFAFPVSLCVNALLISSVSGYVFLRLLLRFLRGGGLWYFAVYCAILGGWTAWYFQ